VGPPATDRRWLVPGVVLGVLVLAYLLDLLAGQGDIPRGVQVSGVRGRRLSEAAARQTLLTELTPDLRRDVPIQAGAVAHHDQAGRRGSAGGLGRHRRRRGRPAAQPVHPARVVLHHSRVDVVTQVTGLRLADALDGINTLVRTEPTDGGVRFHRPRPDRRAPRLR